MGSAFLNATSPPGANVPLPPNLNNIGDGWNQHFCHTAMHKRKSVIDPVEDEGAEGTRTPVRRASVGKAVIEQEALLEVGGKTIPTGKREYWAYCVLCGCPHRN